MNVVDVLSPVSLARTVPTGLFLDIVVDSNVRAEGGDVSLNTISTVVKIDWWGDEDVSVAIRVPDTVPDTV